MRVLAGVCAFAACLIVQAHVLRLARSSLRVPSILRFEGSFVRALSLRQPACPAPARLPLLCAGRCCLVVCCPWSLSSRSLFLWPVVKLPPLIPTLCLWFDLAAPAFASSRRCQPCLCAACLASARTLPHRTRACRCCWLANWLVLSWVDCFAGCVVARVGWRLRVCCVPHCSGACAATCTVLLARPLHSEV